MPNHERYTRETWAQEKLTRALDRIAGSTEGNRHNEVLGASASVADYVADGAIPRAETEAALVNAATAVGLSGKRAKEARQCVRFGLDKGKPEGAWYPWSATREPTVDRYRWVGAKRGIVEIRPVQSKVDAGPKPLPTCGLTSDALRTTLFPSTKRTQGLSESWTWGKLAERCAQPHELAAEDGKADLPLWTWAELEDDSRARRDDGLDSKGEVRTRDATVYRLHTLVLDYDDDPAFSLDMVRRWWGDVRYVAHTSWHHQVVKQAGKTAHPAMGRGRVILGLSRPTTVDEHMKIAEWVIGCGRGQVGKPEIKTPARAYYEPAIGPQGHYEHEAHLVDTVIDVDALLEQIGEETVSAEAEEAERVPDEAILPELDISSETGRVKNTLRNIVIILDADQRWKGRLHRCEFSHRDLLDTHPLTDAAEVETAVWLSNVYRLDAAPDRIHSAATAVAARYPLHPVRSYLDSLTWDGKIRTLHWLEKAGCENPEDGLTLIYGRKWLISAVARVYVPGCQADSAIILAGPKGYGKTSALRTIAGLDWHAESAIQIGDKDSYQQLQGTWIYELGELDSLRKSEVSAVKQYITARVDRFRPSYGRNVVERKRQCVFAGTTNDVKFLAETDRRWWVRRVVRRAELQWLATWRDQLWAEAVHRYRAGEVWHLDDEEEARQTSDVEAYLHVDPWEDAVREHVTGLSKVKVQDILTQRLGLKLYELNKGHEQRVTRMLADLGWSSKPSNGVRYWVAPKIDRSGSTDSTETAR